MRDICMYFLKMISLMSGHAIQLPYCFLRLSFKLDPLQVRIWCRRSGEELLVLSHHSYIVWSVQVSLLMLSIFKTVKAINHLHNLNVPNNIKV